MSDVLREKIARKLYEQQGLEATDPWDDALARREGLGMDRHSGNQVACLLLADAILELPEIKEALAAIDRIVELEQALESEREDAHGYRTHPDTWA